MTDNKFDIYCPACGKKMVKVYMQQENIHVDLCLNGCGGIYFDNREFDRYNEKHENAEEIFKQFEEKTFKEIDTSEKRCCPVCGSNMVKNFSSINKKIEVDDCYICGGKFLDYGELKLIREEYPNDKLRANAAIQYAKKGIKTQSYLSPELDENIILNNNEYPNFEYGFQTKLNEKYEAIIEEEQTILNNDIDEYKQNYKNIKEKKTNFISLFKLYSMIVNNTLMGNKDNYIVRVENPNDRY